VECDEAYITAGHKGQPAKVIAAQRKSRCRKLKGSRGRGTLATERPPIFGMIQRNGEVRIQMLECSTRNDSPHYLFDNCTWNSCFY